MIDRCCGSRHQWATGNASNATLQRGQIASSAHKRVRGLIVGAIVLRTRLTSATLHAVDAKHQIGDGAEEWREPDKPDPSDR